MDFIQRFVAEKARELVELVHQAGRKAMMFLGDNWIGTEPTALISRKSAWTPWWEAWEAGQRCALSPIFRG